MDQDTWRKLECFARAELGQRLSGQPLTPTSRLREDLDVTDFDAIEFISKWAETFDVDVQDFPIDRYFAPEGIELWSWPFKRHRPSEKKIPLTLEMLADAMDLGRWCIGTIEAMHTPARE